MDTALGYISSSRATLGAAQKPSAAHHPPTWTTSEQPLGLEQPYRDVDVGHESSNCEEPGSRTAGVSSSSRRRNQLPSAVAQAPRLIVEVSRKGATITQLDDTRPLRDGESRGGRAEEKNLAVRRRKKEESSLSSLAAYTKANVGTSSGPQIMITPFKLHCAACVPQPARSIVATTEREAFDGREGGNHRSRFASNAEPGVAPECARDSVSSTPSLHVGWNGGNKFSSNTCASRTGIYPHRRGLRAAVASAPRGAEASAASSMTFVWDLNNLRTPQHHRGVSREGRCAGGCFRRPPRMNRFLRAYHPQCRKRRWQRLVG